MKFFKKYINTLTILLSAVVLSACSTSNIFSSTANAIVSPSTDLIFNVSKDVNPDLYERASPVVVTIYELSSRTIFDTQDFFSLYEDSQSILGPDLLNKQELELQPEQKLTHTLVLNKNARYVGIVVAYRDIDKSRWRGVVEVSPTGYKNINVNIEKLATYVKD